MLVHFLSTFTVYYHKDANHNGLFHRNRGEMDIENMHPIQCQTWPHVRCGAVRCFAASEVVNM